MECFLVAVAAAAAASASKLVVATVVADTKTPANFETAVVEDRSVVEAAFFGSALLN